MHNFPPDFSGRLPQHPRAGNRVLCAHGEPSSTPGRHGHPQVIWLFCIFFCFCFIFAYSLPCRRKALCVPSCDLDAQFICACNFIQAEGLCLTAVLICKVIGVHTYRLSFKKIHWLSRGALGSHWERRALEKNKV